MTHDNIALLNIITLVSKGFHNPKPMRRWEKSPPFPDGRKRNSPVSDPLPLFPFPTWQSWSERSQWYFPDFRLDYSIWIFLFKRILSISSSSPSSLVIEHRFVIRGSTTSVTYRHLANKIYIHCCQCHEQYFKIGSKT